VISREEWARLQSAALGAKSPAGPVSDRKERHERSKAIVKNWENTIEVENITDVINHKPQNSIVSPTDFIGPAIEETPC
jgi:hypothetical protein